MEQETIGRCAKYHSVDLTMAISSKMDTDNVYIY